MKSFALKLGFPLALIFLYLALQPGMFGAGNLTFARGGDQLLIVNPILSFASKYDAFHDPLIRLWNGEFDLYHSPITNIRYPFFFLWAGDTGNLFETSRYVYFIAQLHHVIGGIGAYILGRAIGVRPLAAFAGAVFFMFCQNNTLLSPFYWRLAATAWTPFALAGVWLVATGKAPKRGILIGAPAIAMLVFAKSTQPLAYFAYLAFFFTLAAFLTTYLRNKAIMDLRMPVLTMSILVGIAILLCFPVLFPVIQHQSEYIRWTTDGPVVGGGFKVTYEATQQHAYPLHGIWNVLVPLPKMFSIGSSFLGAGAVAAIGAAFLSKSHRVLVIILSLVIVYFIANGFGDAFKVSRLTYKFPILSSVRQLTSHYIFVVVAASVLVAIGFENILDLTKKRPKVFILCVCGLTALLAAYGVFSNANLLNSNGGVGFAGIALIAAPVLFASMLFVSAGKKRNIVALICIVLIAIPGAKIRSDRSFDLETSNLYLGQSKIQDTIAAWDAVAKIKPGAKVSSFVKTPYPEDTRKISHYQINSLALFVGLRAFNVGYTPRPHAEFKRWNWVQNRPEQAILRGTEFLLTDQDISKIVTDKKLEKIGMFGQLALYQVENPYIQASIECLNTNETKNDKLLSWCAPQKNFSDIQVLKSSNTEFEYKIEADGQTYLKHWGWANGGWKAQVDGKPAVVIPLGADRIAVKIQPGDKSVLLRYMPNDYKYSWLIFWLGLIAWFIVFFSDFLGKKLRTAFSRTSGPKKAIKD